MQLVGQLEALEVDGYERLLLVRPSAGQALCCTMLEAGEYLDPGAPSAKLSVGQQVTFDLLLDLARVDVSLDEAELQGLFQASHSSPSTMAVGVVVQLLAEDACLLRFSGAEPLHIESELPASFTVGTRVRAVGELRAIRA